MATRSEDRMDDVRALVEPVLADLGLELFDVVRSGSGHATVVRVLVDRDGGVDLDAVTAATEALEPVLDARAPVRGPYTLEVSSPGLERPLRRPEHFARAVGATVTVKARDAEGHAERVRGVLAAVDDDGITVGTGADARHLAFDAVEQARTVFEWGAAPKPGKGSKPGRKKEAVAR